MTPLPTASVPQVAPSCVTVAVPPLTMNAVSVLDDGMTPPQLGAADQSPVEVNQE